MKVAAWPRKFKTPTAKHRKTIIIDAMGGVIAAQNRPGSRSYKSIVDRYGKRCQWLKNDKFLKDLEGDSVDTEILDEELRVLQEEEPRTCRGKTVKILESSPIQIAMCVLILIDAGIVVTEILIDLHAMRSQQEEASSALNQTLEFLRIHFNEDELSEFSASEVPLILERLRRKHQESQAKPGSCQCQNSDVRGVEPSAPVIFTPTPGKLEAGSQSQLDSRFESGVENRKTMQNGGNDGNVDDMKYSNSLEVPVSHLIREKRDGSPESGRSTPVDPVESFAPGRDTISGESKTIKRDFNRQNGYSNSENSLDYFKRKERIRRKEPGTRGRVHRRSSEGRLKDTVALDYVTRSPPSAGELLPVDPSYAPPTGSYGDGHVTYTSVNDYVKKLRNIAHILHYVSIAILGVFALQALLKLIGMGSEYFKSKLEVFDGTIIVASFILDVVFVEGLNGNQGEETVALLIVFLLWRILRVINGIMVTSKQQQEFRIKLQRRACRRAEKKVENLEEDLSWKGKEISSLKSLCLRNGATEEDIETATPKRRPLFHKMDTSSGLSSIASLSLGFTMTMRPPGTTTPSSSASSSSSTPGPVSAAVNSPSSRSMPTFFRRQRLFHPEPTSTKDPNCDPPKKTPSFQLERIGEEETDPLHVATTNTTNTNTNTTSASGKTPKDIAPPIDTNHLKPCEEVKGCRVEVKGREEQVKGRDVLNSVDVRLVPCDAASVAEDAGTRSSTSSSAAVEPELFNVPRTSGLLDVVPDNLKSDSDHINSQPNNTSIKCNHQMQQQQQQVQQRQEQQVQQQQQPPEGRRSIEGAARCFRWRSTGGGNWKESDCNSNASVSKGVRLESGITEASLRRSAWANALRRSRNDRAEV